MRPFVFPAALGAVMALGLLVGVGAFARMSAADANTNTKGRAPPSAGPKPPAADALRPQPFGATGAPATGARD